MLPSRIKRKTHTGIMPLRLGLRNHTADTIHDFSIQEGDEDCMLSNDLTDLLLFHSLSLATGRDVSF